MYVHIPLTCSAWNRWEGLFDILAKTKLNKTWNTNTESKPKKYKRKQTGNVGSGITSKINIEARVFFTKLLDEPTTMKLKKNDLHLCDSCGKNSCWHFFNANISKYINWGVSQYILLFLPSNFNVI